MHLSNRVTVQPSYSSAFCKCFIHGVVRTDFSRRNLDACCLKHWKNREYGQVCINCKCVQTCLMVAVSMISVLNIHQLDICSYEILGYDLNIVLRLTAATEHPSLCAACIIQPCNDISKDMKYKNEDSLGVNLSMSAIFPTLGA